MRILREPLLHFLLIGGAMFLLWHWRVGGVPESGDAASARPEIVVSQEALARMRDQFARTWQRPANADEEKGLVEDHVRNEIYYRQAVALGLDRDDEVIRRRVRMRMEFLLEDMGSLAKPTEEELRAYMAQHRESYAEEARLSLRQVFVNTGKRGPIADADARRMLAQLVEGTDPATLGDATMLEMEVSLSSGTEIASQFGDEFAKAVMALKPGAWSGPVRSSFGLHLVQVRERREGRSLSLEEVRPAVSRDWLAARQRELKDAAYARMREQYRVIIEKPKAAAATTAPTSPASTGLRTGARPR